MLVSSACRIDGSAQSGAKIKDHRQVEKALAGRDIGNVGTHAWSGAIRSNWRAKTLSAIGKGCRECVVTRNRRRRCAAKPRPDSPPAQALEASLSRPCTRALTASPRRARITGGRRTRLTPTLAFVPSNAPFQACRRGPRGRPDGPDAGRPREGGVNRSYALFRSNGFSRRRRGRNIGCGITISFR